MPAMYSLRAALIGAVGSALIIGLSSGAAAAEPPAPKSTLQEVARFDHQATGVAVTETGRVFVNFPRWSEDAPVSVAELKNGALPPYPNEEWNKWRNAAPLSAGDHFVCVQSVFADGHGSLWVLDPAAPNTEHVIKGGPKTGPNRPNGQQRQAPHFF